MIVGLTGGIGSGKSEVASRFAVCGADVLDADDVAHALSAPGEPGHRAVVDQFGAACLREDGELDRAWLRERAFNDPAFRGRLENALHPLIGAAIENAIAAWRGAYGILVVPLLLERGGVRRRVDRVLVVDCPEDEQVRRVVTRSGLTPDEVRRIMATQLARADRLASADDVIDNGGDLPALVPQVAALDRLYREIAARPMGTPVRQL
jgi:dephospho-CoA kinase